MHREYHPDELRLVSIEHPGISAGVGSGHVPTGLAGPIIWVGLLGGLLVLELLFGLYGWGLTVLGWRVSPIRVAALLGSARVVYQALEGLLHGAAGADIALALASLAALIIGEDFVAAEVVLIALIGELLEAWTSQRALRAIRSAFDRAPRTARVRRDGRLLEIPASEVSIGETVVVAPGDRVPVDGPIVHGSTSVDESALTGESVPVDRGPGDLLWAGTINQFGQVEMRAERVGSDTTLGHVQRLVEASRKKKSQWERTADRLARWFLPLVLSAAALTVAVGLLLDWEKPWTRGVAILVVACPCALVLATPAAMMASLAWMGRNGIILKGGSALERLATCDTIAFDKTGTLTQGTPTVLRVAGLGDTDANQILQIAATAEQGSRHPLAVAVLAEAMRRNLEPSLLGEARALPGAGVFARREGDDSEILVGSPSLLEERGVDLGESGRSILNQFDEAGQSALLVAVGNRLIGAIGVGDSLRPEAHDVVRDLKKLGIREVALLTGDRRKVAEAVARRTHIVQVESELRPEQKARWVRERQDAGHRVIMVGDGINDAPALAAADVGIALGRRGADLAAEAGDLVLLGEPLRKLPDLIGLSRATVRVLRQNIIGFAFGLNGLAIALAALGILGPVPAAILHQVGSLLVILNSMRLLTYGDLVPEVRRRLHEAEHAIERWDDRFDLGQLAEIVWLQRGMIGGLGFLAVVVGYALTGLSVIGPDEAGLVRRMGRHVGTLGPGLHLRFPWPVEMVSRIKPAKIKSLAVGLDGSGGTRLDDLGWGRVDGHAPRDLGQDEGLMITGDGRLIEISARVQYRPGPSSVDQRRLVYGVMNVEELLRAVTEASLREQVAQEDLERILTGSRRELARKVRETLARRISDSRLGVELVGLDLVDIHPPTAVLDSFRDVSRAEREAEAKAIEANTYLAEKAAAAKGQSESIQAQALASKTEEIESASAEATVFQYMASARRSEPGLNDWRVYVESSGQALQGREKWILSPAIDAGRRHLIVSTPEMVGRLLSERVGSRSEPIQATDAVVSPKN